MVKAVFTDFYGTIVHEDGAVIKEITREICATGTAPGKAEIGAYWWDIFQSAFLSAYGDNFRTQRELEYLSLAETIQHFQSSADAGKLSELMFTHWQKPPVFEESHEFFRRCPVPVYIVSNIDRADILQAVEFHSLHPAGIFTSEDARSYKPRRELFDYALMRTGLSPEEVVHIGDSLSSDIRGAAATGLSAVWINRGGREVPPGVISVADLLQLYDTEFFG